MASAAATVVPVRNSCGKNAYVCTLFCSYARSQLMALNVHAPGKPHTADWISFDLQPMV